MTIRCLDCTGAALRDEADRKRNETLRDMARHGFINCTRSEFKARFFNPSTPRECKRFEAADKATTAARIAFFTKQKENPKQCKLNPSA
jgi:hypothetical protein